MKLPFPATLLASALLLPAITHAADAPLTDTLKAFTRCDASFFAKLNAHRDEWKAYAPLKHDKDFAWIAVRNRTLQSDNAVPVSTPPIVGLKLLSYVDESSDLGTLGNYYYWGFVVKGNVSEVASLVAPLMEQPGLLLPMGGAYVRSEVKDGNGWRVIVPEPGTAPGKNRVERVLLIEPEGKQGTQTRLSCSLQGGVNAAMLAQLRPDIAPVDYPQATSETSIASVAVPQAVLNRLDSPLLQPKFKTLNYTYVTREQGKLSGRPVSVEFTADGHWLNKNEIYSENFHVERQVQADLIQLKAKMNGIGDGRVLLTREADVQLPQTWSAGQTLSAKLRMSEVPARPTDEPSGTSMTCKVGQRFPAQQVFASLSGDAIRLECDFGSFQSTRAFIEDLGVTVELESTSDNLRSVHEVTALEVVR